jgi:hypothetical protein
VLFATVWTKSFAENKVITTLYSDYFVPGLACTHSCVP